MTCAAQEPSALEFTRYHHCISQCPNRALSWRENVPTGKDDSYRQSWFIKLLRGLAAMSTRHHCACAVLFDRYHWVIRADEAQAKGFGHQDAADRPLGPIVQSADSGLHGTSKASPRRKRRPARSNRSLPNGVSA